MPRKYAKAFSRTEIPKPNCFIARTGKGVITVGMKSGARDVGEPREGPARARDGAGAEGIGPGRR